MIIQANGSSEIYNGKEKEIFIVRLFILYSTWKNQCALSLSLSLEMSETELKDRLCLNDKGILNE